MKKLTKAQVESLENYIQKELLKRGFTAPIKSFEEVTGRGTSSYIQFHTEDFYTTPILFERLKVSNFNSSITTELKANYDKVEFSVKTVWMTIHATWQNFDGGSNGTKIFEITAEFWGEHQVANITMQ